MAKVGKRAAFSEESTVILIKLYRANECLWNVKLPEYRNNAAREVSIKKIADEMGIPEDVVIRRINSLRATYLLEKKKVTASRKTGTSTDDLYIPSVSWYDLMSFLEDVIIPRKTVSSLDAPKNKNEGDELQTSHDVPVSTPSTSRAPVMPVKRRYLEHAVQGASQPRAKRYKTPDTLNAAIHKLSSVMEQDMFDNFGTLIASQLQRLPLPDALQLQSDISAMVNQCMLAHYRSLSPLPSHSSSASDTTPVSRPSSCHTPMSSYSLQPSPCAIDTVEVVEDIHDATNPPDAGATEDIFSVAVDSIRDLC